MDSTHDTEIYEPPAIVDRTVLDPPLVGEVSAPIA